MIIKKLVFFAGLFLPVQTAQYHAVVSAQPIVEDRTTPPIRPVTPTPDTTEKAPQIIYDPARLPAPVRMMREKILKIAKSGNIEALRPLLAADGKNALIKPAGVNEDPIAFLKELSGDGDGLEILAILIDILNSGCVHLDNGNRQEAYVWPYFVAVPLDKLSKPQLVEAYQIMTANDLETIREIGTYVYFRAGISSGGQWLFFVTGDGSDLQPE